MWAKLSACVLSANVPTLTPSSYSVNDEDDTNLATPPCPWYPLPPADLHRGSFLFGGAIAVAGDDNVDDVWNTEGVNDGVD